MEKSKSIESKIATLINLSQASHVSRGKIIVVEGLSKSGKSSLIDKFVNEGAIPIPETSEAPSFFSIWGKQKWYLERNRERDLKARKISVAGKTVIMDRNLVSSLAFCFAYDSINNTKMTESMMDMIYRENTLIPTTYFYLRTLPEDSLSRRERTKRKISIELDNPLFVRALYNFYEFFFNLEKIKRITRRNEN